MNKNLKKTLFLFIPFFVAITLLCGLIYWAVQQNYRLTANDPQIQMAEDGAIYLEGGGVANFDSSTKIEISKSLSPFIMIYGKDKKLVTSSAFLHGKAPALPLGVLDMAKKKGESRITWQPSSDTRNAIVVVYYKGLSEGYILAGKSLKEVELRENLLTKGIGLGWVVINAITFLSLWVLNSNLFPKLKKLR